MDPIQPHFRATQVDSLEVVPQNGSVAVLAGGMPLLDGTDRDGHFYLRFTERSGARSEFDVTGPSTPGELHLAGTGTLHLAGFALRDATVQVAPAGIEIAAPMQWGEQSTVVRFETKATPGHWSGRMEARETLPCLMTRREVLRISITIELNAHARHSKCSVLAVLDGRNIEVPISPESNGARDGFFLHLRRKTLGAVRQFLLEELRVCEAKLLAVDSDDDGAEGPMHPGFVVDDHLARDIAVPRTNAPERRRESPSAPSSGGYLPALTKPTRSPGQRASVMVRGYIDPRHTAPFISGPGYLPATSGSHRLATGYLPNSRKTEVRGNGGYLPTAWQGASKQATPRTAPLQANNDGLGASPAATTQKDLNTVIDYERVAYAVLRCKDLLQAIETAASQGAGA